VEVPVGVLDFKFVPGEGDGFHRSIRDLEESILPHIVEDHADPDHEEGLAEGDQRLPGVSLFDSHVVDDLSEHELLLSNSNLYLLVSIWRGLSEVTRIAMIFIGLVIHLA
jgi:hypothetical protein